MRIFEHNFVADKARIRRRAAARQGLLTQYATKFAEKTCAYAYEDRFLLSCLPMKFPFPKGYFCRLLGRTQRQTDLLLTFAVSHAVGEDLFNIGYDIISFVFRYNKRKTGTQLSDIFLLCHNYTPFPTTAYCTVVCDCMISHYCLLVNSL